MRVLLTGGSGMVGRNILEQAPNGFELIAPCSREYNLLDRTATIRMLLQIKPDLIIHAAGVVGGIQANQANPAIFLAENTTMGLNVLMGAARVAIPKVINLGSSCMYPISERPHTENDILTGKLEPTNEGYALAKIVTERLGGYLSNDKCCIRTIIPCNMFGKHDRGFDSPGAHLIPSLIRKARDVFERKTKEFVVGGNGEATRELMYAEDFARLLWKAVGMFYELPPRLNLGVGKAVKIKDVARIIRDYMIPGVPITYDETYPEGVFSKTLNVMQAERFGLVPDGPLTERIHETIDWYWGKEERPVTESLYNSYR